MREIKFRAWHKLTKVMIDWRMLMLLMDGKPIAITEGIEKLLERGVNPKGEERTTLLSNINIFSSPGINLMQFTGLLDKNGKEIYEGDIVKFTYSRSGGEKIMEVRWKGTGFKPTSLSEHNQKEMEIIGNSFENPELLTNQPPQRLRNQTLKVEYMIKKALCGR